MPSPENRSLIYHGLVCFSFVFNFLGDESFEFDECARQIEQSYDPKNPQTAAVIAAFRAERGRIIKKDMFGFSWRVEYDQDPDIPEADQSEVVEVAK